VFDYDAIETLRSLSVEEPKWRGHITEDKTGVHAQAHEGGPWKVWEWPRAGRTYMLAADACAGKASGDFAHAVVVDVASWDQVACYHAKTEPHQFARELRNAGWLWQASPEMPALLAPEANNHGAGVMAMLREWGYPRIYRHSRFDGETVTESGGLGFFTSLKTKPIAISALQQAIREQAVGIGRPFVGQYPRPAKRGVCHRLLHRRPSSMSDLIDPLPALARDRIPRKAATKSPVTSCPSAPEERSATRRPRLVIQIRLPLAARSTREDSLFFASNVPKE
jgi:hypothetical protein